MQDDTVALEQAPTKRTRVRQFVEGDFEHACHFSSGGPCARALVHDADDRVKPEAADMHIDRREGSEDPNRLDVKTDLLARFPKRRLFVGFPRIDDSSRQRHLATVPAQTIGAYGQDEVGFTLGLGRGGKGRRCSTGGNAGPFDKLRARGEDEQQAGSVADVRQVEPARPLARRNRSQTALGVEAGEWTRERRFERRLRQVEPHLMKVTSSYGTIAIDEQLP